MEYKFIVNTENVNSYGYRVLTKGIDVSQYERNPVVLWMHERPNVIGRARLSKEGDQMVCWVTFNSKNKIAAEIEQQVKDDFIRMCSMYAEVIEASSDASLTLPGQKYETVTKCKLIEISIVDIGGNDDAIRLSAGDGTAPKIKLLNNSKQENKMSELKVIALSMGMDANTGEAAILQEISSLKLSKATAEATAKEWENKYLTLQRNEATKMVDKAVLLGLIPEDLKDVQIKAFETDFEGQNVKLTKLITEKETENEVNGVQNVIGSAVKLSKEEQKQKSGNLEESFDYLQKHDPVKLAKIRAEEPQKYAKLSADYSAGVRYTQK
ncbi:MAG TPA: hypothetical protein DCQ50_14715 [Chryseobacterium sp.]|nr:hypothetical protein [Chryseobacterium sp.]